MTWCFLIPVYIHFFESNTVKESHQFKIILIFKWSLICCKVKKLVCTSLDNEKWQINEAWCDLWLIVWEYRKEAEEKISDFCEYGSVERNECSQCFPVYWLLLTLSPCECIANWTSLISALLQKSLRMWWLFYTSSKNQIYFIIHFIIYSIIPYRYNNE